jgi:prophage antirepressor-like protein
MEPELSQPIPTTILTFPVTQQQVRMVGTPDRPEWVAADVCKVLGIANVSYALREFDDTEKGSIVNNYTPLLTVTEAGLYRLVLVSRKPAALAFKRWLCHEVIPSLRKYGCYPPPKNPGNPTALMLHRLADSIERQERLEWEQAQLTRRLDDVAEKVRDMDGDTRYRTVLAYGREKGIDMPRNIAQHHGIELARIHRQRGVRIGKVSDERHGHVNSYRIDLIEEYFATLPSDASPETTY